MDKKILDTLTPIKVPGSSHDENDILLRDVVKTSPDAYDKATHVIIGCPQDIGVVRNHGRPGAAKAPEAIRQALYKLKTPPNNESVRLIDLGDVDSSDDLRIIHECLHKAVEQIIWDGKIVIILGGGNDISFPDAKAVHDVHSDFVAINVDAHLDIRKSGVIHSGTPYRNLIDGRHLAPANLYEIGIQPWANSAKYLEEAEAMGINIQTLGEIEAMGVGHFFDRLFDMLNSAPLFAGLDMDCVRASDAPGVSAPSPVGLTATDILNFAARCRTYGETAVFEITEVNPEMDIDGRTARLAALTLYTFLYGNR